DILSEIDDALEKRELVKIQLLQNTMLEPSEVKNYIEENSTIQIVQVIGNVLILYKSSSNEKNQSISDEVRAL
ncbi:YhbY family RNA-binding protein, partial [Salmonella enterica]|uniref:YhbY family RNA-binding protein n=1 Tax=Salmonella enterica TaxID=28901 RepID=UPI000C21E5C3